MAGLSLSGEEDIGAAPRIMRPRIGKGKMGESIR
jgi:hypothetical protein